MEGETSVSKQNGDWMGIIEKIKRESREIASDGRKNSLRKWREKI